jgi:hypothetical protein
MDPLESGPGQTQLLVDDSEDAEMDPLEDEPDADSLSDETSEDDSPADEDEGGESDDFDAQWDETVSAVEDLQSFRATAQRTLGHVSANQRAIKALQDSAVDPDELSELRETVSVLAQALRAVAPEELGNLDEITRKADIRRAVEEKVGRARASQSSSEADVDVVPSEWQAATKAVHAYARGKGVDANTIPQEVYDRAQESGDPNRAEEILMEEIDRRAEAPGKTTNRRARKAAGRNTRTATRAPNTKGTLTFERLQQMTEAQILQVDPSELERVLAAGPNK